MEDRVYPLIQSGSIHPLIVVGIDNGGSTDKSTKPETDRANEFLPYPDSGFPPKHLYPADPPDPNGKLYPDFLVNEVMPLIQRHYRIKTGRSNTVLAGCSYGGVSALYTVIRKPGVFGGLLLESAPLWIGTDRQLLKDAQKTGRWPASVYIGLGTKETDEDIRAEGRADTEELLGTIRSNSPKARLKFVVEEGGVNDASSWGRRCRPHSSFFRQPLSEFERGAKVGAEDAGRFTRQWSGPSAFTAARSVGHCPFEHAA